MIFVLKVGDSQPIVNKVALLDTPTPPLSPLYIAGTTAMARSAALAPAVTGGLPAQVHIRSVRPVMIIQLAAINTLFVMAVANWKPVITLCVFNPK